MDFVIPERVIKKNALGNKMDGLPPYLKKALAEEFSRYDKDYYQSAIDMIDKQNQTVSTEFNAITFKLNDVVEQDSITKLGVLEADVQYALEQVDERFNYLEEKKILLIETDMKIYTEIMTEVKKAFMAQTNLDVSYKCPCYSRQTSKMMNMCPPFKAVVEELRDKKYHPSCGSIIISPSEMKVTHVLKCKLF